LHGGFERTRIDLEQLVAFLDDVAFVEKRLLQLPGDLRADGNAGVRLDVADGGDIDRDIALRNSGCHNRLSTGAATASSASPASSAPPAPEAAGGRSRRLTLRRRAVASGHRHDREKTRDSADPAHHNLTPDILRDDKLGTIT